MRGVGALDQVGRGGFAAVGAKVERDARLGMEGGGRLAVAQVGDHEGEARNHREDHERYGYDEVLTHGRSLGLGG
ncbi:hypothetical protein JT358_10065 [Micrococcales bacterium 31B]|nr:hypothetical protein [Micrococcales bacterium 31B]